MAGISGRLGTRVIVYLVVIAALVTWQLVDRSDPQQAVQDEAETAADAPPSRLSYQHRVATAEEWALSIAELGQRQLAKLQPWIGVNGWSGVDGELVWWHDGSEPRIAYLPAPGEQAEQASVQLMIEIRAGRAILYGDPEFGANILEWSSSYALPPEWAVLSAPRDGAPVAPK